MAYKPYSPKSVGKKQTLRPEDVTRSKVLAQQYQRLPVGVKRTDFGNSGKDIPWSWAVNGVPQKYRAEFVANVKVQTGVVFGFGNPNRPFKGSQITTKVRGTTYRLGDLNTQSPYREYGPGNPSRSIIHLTEYAREGTLEGFSGGRLSKKQLVRLDRMGYERARVFRDVQNLTVRGVKNNFNPISAWKAWNN